MAATIRVPARPTTEKPTLVKTIVKPKPIKLPPGYIGSAGYNANPSEPPPRTYHDNLSRGPQGNHGHRTFTPPPVVVLYLCVGLKPEAFCAPYQAPASAVVPAEFVYTKLPCAGNPLETLLP